MLIFIIGLSIVLSFTIAVLLYFYTTWTTFQGKIVSSGGIIATTHIPGWNRKPADPEKGDSGEFHKYGTIHQCLLYIHNNGYRPIVAFWWGRQRVVSICSPEMFKDTIKLTNRPKQLAEVFEPITGSLSIMYANGQEWEDRRKWIYEPLKGTALKSYIPIFTKIAGETISKWSQLEDDNIVDLQEECLIMTLKGTTRSCFGSLFNDEQEIHNMSHLCEKVWIELEQNLLSGLPEPGSERERICNDYAQQLKSTLQRVITRRQDGEGEESIPFIDALLQSDVPDEQAISDGITILLGGLHSAGYLMFWTLHYLMLNNETYNKLVEEMKEKVGPDQGDKLKSYVNNQNTLLRQVLKEVLRLTSLVTFSARCSDEDIVVGGYLIPAGTPIMMALGVSLKNKTVWKKTEKFDHTQCPHLQGKDAMAFVPFGFGRRKCPGYYFAYVEVSVYLTILLQKFTFKRVGRAKDVDKIHGLITTPKELLKFSVSALN